jgi:sarcosine oxidase subunit alpha
VSGPGHRLASGGAIDRARPLEFRFDGTAYTGYAGDTLASALLANGVSTIGRSFKYHRRRGLFAAGAEEPNALVDVGEGALRVPNLKATQVALYDGLVARSVNAWPSAAFDLGAATSMLGRFLPAGFYYKTFMWPNWHLFEPMIRRMAGLGRAPGEPDPDRYEKRHAHCDVLVVGAGPSGLTAALAAGRGGARVILADERPAAGGALLWDDETIGGRPAANWVAGVLAELAALPDVTVLADTTVTGYYDHNHLVADQRLTAPGQPAAMFGPPRERLWKIRAKRVVLATGAIERPLVFGNNDRPGVMLASAVRFYLARHGVAAGRRAVLFANNDDGYRTALTLHAQGMEVAAVIDPRTDSDGAWPSQARALGIPVENGCVVTRALGRAQVTGAEIARLDGGGARRISCDLLAVSGGWNPAVHLFCQSGGKLDYDAAAGRFLPGTSVQAEQCAGACAGATSLAEALAQGAAAGIDAARRAGFKAEAIKPPAVEPAPQAPPLPLWRVPPGAAATKAWVDLLSDVTADDVMLAGRENFASVEHMKRYTTTGMAPDQGKTSNINALAILGEATGRDLPSVGTTRFRPPYDPVTMGAMAGRQQGEFYRPRFHLPMHDWHAAHGAFFEDYGGWQRPTAYLKPGEDLHAATAREALAVRSGVGLFDGSTLGKIEVAGPDAATFLDRMYVGTMSTLAPGRVRYGLMLNEMGIVIDDGVCTRLGPERFLVGSSSGAAARVAQLFEEWLQCEYVDLQVLVTPMTHQWAVLTLTGPRARAVLKRVGTDIDLAHQAFPHMALREGMVGDVPARVFRVSFTGETSYEINVPARRGPELWERILVAGAADGITPFGIEAMMVLRIEKGYIHVGGETDGTTVPDDIGMGGAIAKKKSDFVGRRSLLRPEAVRPGRLQLVGLQSVIPSDLLPVGAHVLLPGGAGGSDGYVTSSAHSPILGRAVALAMVRDGRARKGSTVGVFDEGRRHQARIVDPCFYDPEGTRLHG